jgi:hypothetical protein
MGEVGFAAGEKVVETNDFVSLAEQTLAEMGTQKACSASDQNAHGRGLAGNPDPRKRFGSLTADGRG